MRTNLSESPPVSAAERAACASAIRTGSRSFYAASLLLPEQVRQPAYALYAFCRLSDDAIDLGAGDGTALPRLHQRLDRIYEGWPGPEPADRAFAEVVARFALPRALPEALLEGFAWDAEGRRYATLSEVRSYGARVAGSVGAMMAVLMGVRSPAALSRACDLGIAMQLTNIVRDIGEDARAGRLYLPTDLLQQAGLDPDRWLRTPRSEARLAPVVERMLAEAERLYDRALPGIGALPLACRPAIHAARLIYREIGRSVLREGIDPVRQRAVVRGGRKVELLAQALAATAAPRLAGAAAPVLPEARFLVDAVLATPAPPKPTPWWDVVPQLVQVLDLIERLERRDRVPSTVRRTG